MRRRILTLSVALAGVLLLASPVNAATPVANWQMNEAPGATTMVDSSGNGLHGTVGAHVQTGVALTGGGTGYRFPYLKPNTPPADPEHIVRVAHNTRLNPGTGNFAVEFRMRTTHSFGNVIQKGQATTAGGQVKFQQPKGYMSCMFKSPAGTASIKSSIFTSDGAWHTIRCERTPTEVNLYVDGVFNKRIRHTTGNINNTKAWTIGGKFDCDTSDPNTGADSCDYWAGEMDWVKLTKG